VLRNTIDEMLVALYNEKGDSAQLALDGQLFAEQTEEVNLEALFAAAMRNFNPNAETIEEGELEAQWERELRHALRMAEMRYREWWPPIVGKDSTAAEMRQAVAALSGKSPTRLGVQLTRMQNLARQL
jgi:hypothetical protein